MVFRGVRWARLAGIHQVAAAVTMLIGGTVLVGHALNTQPLVTIAPGLPPMSLTNAVLAICAGAALWAAGPAPAGPARRWVSRLLAAVVVIGAVVIIVRRGTSLPLPYLSFLDLPGRQFGFDRGSGQPPLRSPVAFLLIGLSLLAIDLDARRGHRPAQLLATAAALLVGVTVLAAGLGLAPIAEEAHAYVMPIATEVSLLAMAVGVLMSRRDGLAVAVFGSSYLGGRTVRRLAPAVGGVVVLIGTVIAAINRTQQAIDGLALTVAISVLLLTLYLVLLSAGFMLNEVDARQRDLIDELREQRDFSETVLGSLIEGVLAIAPDGTILRVNARWCELTGFGAGEVIGLRPPYPWWRDEPHLRFAAGDAGEFDAELHRRDGTRVPVLVSFRHVVDGTRMLVVTCRDVTERRRMNQQLDHFFTMSRDLLCIAGTNGYFLRVNPAWEHTLGHSTADLLGRPILSFVHPDDRERSAEAAARLSDGSSVAGFDNRFVAADGGYRWLNWSATPADEQGTIYAVARDITDSKKAALALAAARDEALAAAQLKSQFVAMVSHEIRTPMNGVIGLTKLLLDTTLEPAQRRYGEAIRSSARALLAIINDILDFSKIEAGKIALAPDDFDLGNLVEEVAHAAAAAARDKDVDVITYYPPDLPERVRADEGRIRQILLNLAGNAVKFTHAGHILIRVDATFGEYTFSVSDTGIGIDQEKIKQLFEPFIQADATTSREFGGTGLGLSISRQLVELMGGELKVDSTPGEGSRFHFRLSLTEPAGHRPRRVRDELAGRRLLLVDPNPTSAAFLAEHVRTWGTDVAIAATAPDARRALADATAAGRPFDLAVVDHHPPELDGAALVAEMDGPVCLLLTRDAADPLHSGDVLAKPVGPSALYNYLLQQLRPPAGPAHNAHRPTVPGTRKRVLLAEDNEINQLVAVDTLDALGYDADIARNGAEAVELAASGDYEAILMDCQMPKLDGYQATSQVRSQEAGRHIPIIAMTAGVLQDDRRRAYQAGMDDFLAKPIDPDELRATLTRWTTHPTPSA
ncbi:ATP-binding protein [Paractinoplanes tereljensis]|uniref:ATP-binding protein n=1 Tax=Paractinoplanes tereljensis TaxID=571912 RepID=UPI001EF1DBB3|nr:ATP-binding protein [Actinoplanes tereljensis]